MDQLIQALSKLPPEQIIQAAKSICMSDISKLIVSEKSLKAKIAEVDVMRNSELVLALPDDEKDKMREIFDTTVLAVKEISKIKR